MTEKNSKFQFEWSDDGSYIANILIRVDQEVNPDEAHEAGVRISKLASEEKSNL